MNHAWIRKGEKKVIKQNIGKAKHQNEAKTSDYISWTEPEKLIKKMITD